MDAAVGELQYESSAGSLFEHTYCTFKLSLISTGITREVKRIITHASCNQSPLTILLRWLVFLTSARPQEEVHLPCQNQPTAEIQTLKSLHSAAAPLIKCAECRVQFAKLQVFCTCKYSLITAIKDDYGRLADGKCNVVLIRDWMHCNTTVC